MDAYYFEHLDNTRQLTLQGHAKGVIGWCMGTPYAEVPLDQDVCPNLGFLELGYCALEYGLLAFLTAQSQTLKVHQ